MHNLEIGPFETIAHSDCILWHWGVTHGGNVHELHVVHYPQEVARSAATTVATLLV